MLKTDAAAMPILNDAQQVSAEQAVRIVVQASDQALEIRAVYPLAGMNR